MKAEYFLDTRLSHISQKYRWHLIAFLTNSNLIATLSVSLLQPTTTKVPSPTWVEAESQKPLLLSGGSDASAKPEQLTATPQPCRAADSPADATGGGGHGGAWELAGSPPRESRCPLPRVHAHHQGNSNDIA
uniref:Mediator complex subunit 11 n=1 Tax=Oryza rufipogon TaxID=4529 RepID=A0A0E0NKG2_ORYRU